MIRSASLSEGVYDIAEVTLMSDLRLQLFNYRLTTAEILYHLPDHPSLLQSFIWQNMDLAPEYPILHRFLDFWVSNIEGRLHSVKVASTALVKPSEMRHANASFTLH
jgi:uncharacterized protein Usg